MKQPAEHPASPSPAAPAPIPARSLLPSWRRINQAFVTRIQRWGLPLNAGVTLVHLYLHPDDTEPARLAERNYLARQTMTFVLDVLEQTGLAQRRPHPLDRRRKHVVLSAKGRRLAARIVEDLVAFESHALAALPPEALSTFRRLVDGYAGALDGQTTAPLSQG